MRKFFRKDEGFTLVELLIVIAIIGVLAAIAIPVFLSQVDKADGASLASDINTVEKAVVAQIAETGTYTVTDAVTPGTHVAVQEYTVSGLGTITSDNYIFVDGTNSSDYCVAITNDATAGAAATMPTPAANVTVESGPGC